MSATSAPFGLRPAFHPSGLDRATAFANPFDYSTGYASNIFKGQAVTLNPGTGYIIKTTSSLPIYGVFDGFEWTDTTGRRRVSNYYPANTAFQQGSAIAYIWNDPQVVYEIQATGSIAQTAIGQEFDISNNDNGSATTGLSQCTMDTTAASANTSKQLRVIDVAPYPGNAWGDAYTIVRVQVAEFQYAGTYDTGATAVVYPVTIA
jgi:hypothetical protein